MNIAINTNHDVQTIFHLERPRLNQLFTEAAGYPLVLICAGAGYGKTSAVQDFLSSFEGTTAWMQLSASDNVGVRFWENFIHTVSLVNSGFSKAAGTLAFPDSEEKFNTFKSIVQKYLPATEKRVLVFDDVHILDDPTVIRFMERIILGFAQDTSIILISRSTPRLNLAAMVSKGRVFNISESDLCFTENEIAIYFRRLEITPQNGGLREIMQDTGGWAFALNLIARFFRKAPGYGGYIRNAMKTNIFQLMESEVWDGISQRVQSFMVRLSLIHHLSFELIELLAGEYEDLIEEMERQNAYLRRDNYINAYLIHPLFLEFLTTKQKHLLDEHTRETYEIAGEWCNKNGFKIDALSYYEKIGDYKTIISILYELPAQMPYDIAKYCMTIFDRAPEEAFDSVIYLALTHVRCSMRLGLWEKAIDLAERYEAKFLELDEDNPFRNANLAGLYLLMSYLRNFVCLSDEVFDFDKYLEKFSKCLAQNEALKSHSTRVRVLGAWANANGSSRKGAPEEYIEAVSRACAYMPTLFNGFMGGEEELVKGELAFFKGELIDAEAFLTQAVKKAFECGQFDILHRAYLYNLRISIARGSHAKAEQAVRDHKVLLDESEYPNRFINQDVLTAVYAYAIGLNEMIPDSLRQDIAPYSHATYIENLENQLKIRYHYLIGNYSPILAYIRDMRQRESYLYGRVALLALEACIYSKLKDRKAAIVALTEAYREAAPNDLIMPFIELGKDMRTLTSAAMKVPGIGIPGTWLEEVNRKAASHAKRRALMIAEYKQSNHIKPGVVLSPRESEVLRDLSHGLSRAEVAASRGLSINTVKMVINNIYNKLGAENIADLIRIAVEMKLV